MNLIRHIYLIHKFLVIQYIHLLLWLVYDLEKERSFTLDTDKHLSCRRLRIIAESYAIKGLYACLLRFACIYLEI